MNILVTGGARLPRRGFMKAALGTLGAPLCLSSAGQAGRPQSKLNHACIGVGGTMGFSHFVDACLGGEMTTCHFLQSGPMTEAILLGTVAVRHPERWLDWEAGRLAIPNAPEAEQYLRRTYRAGWHTA